MSKISAFIKLTRIEHSIMLVLAVIAAELVTGGLPQPIALAASIVTPVLVSMGSFAINDYFDVEADRANKLMKRPLVSGELSMSTAFRSAIILLVVGALASALINIYALVIAVVFASLAFLYSYKMKDIAIIGNFYIAFSMVIPFIYGDFVVSRSLNLTILLICFVVFLSGVAREVQGMIRDIEGDRRARDSKNLLFHINERDATKIVAILYLEAIAISIYMFFFSRPYLYNAVYIIPIAVVDMMLIYVAFGRQFYDSKKAFYKATRNISLAAMGIALIGYLVAALIFVPL